MNRTEPGRPPTPTSPRKPGPTLSSAPAIDLDGADEALAALLVALQARNYGFITPTPETHERVVARRSGRRAKTLRDVFGWNLPFDPDEIDREIAGLLRASGFLQDHADGARSGVRVASLGGLLFLHSPFPTDQPDSVFFGPDTYRFARLIREEVQASDAPGNAVDIGAGAGAGGILAARLRPRARVRLTDVNPKALRLARINAVHAGVAVQVEEGDGLAGVDRPLDLALANPPYIAGSAGRTYRDGGDMHGARLSLDWSVQAIERLAPGGRLVLYTGSAIVDGEDALRRALASACQAHGCTLRYREIDPDIFGSELARPEYREVERIAAVGAIVIRP